MNMHARILALGFAAIAAAAADRTEAAEAVPVSQLVQATHFHGLAVDPQDSTRLLLATHHGVFAVAADGTATLLSEQADDFMGFTPHPADPAVLFASGHPQGGGNLGFIRSQDGGKTWEKLSDGAIGPVDFHQMAVSRADPQRIYGIYGELQLSRDGGASWEELVGAAPAGLIDLAASARDADTLYAATEDGLIMSNSVGTAWQTAGTPAGAATMVEVLADGTIYAFVVGAGLLRGAEGSQDWTVVSNGFGDRYVIHFAADPGDPQRLYAITQKSELLASVDGGATWAPLGAQ
jgi:photosystem II stability/assembly factor-like uncharacterized protein